MDKISIIVPIYNVEKYVMRCLASIRTQTYKNIEILLIDDGSQDKSGLICDELAGKDSRINVIHQRNQGLSAARNTGLKKATGKYILFVDSDDWIDIDYVEKLKANMDKYSSDIAVCGVKMIKNNHIFLMNHFSKERLFNTDEALIYLLKDSQINNYVWNKLYRKSLFNNIRFAEGILFEDVRIMHKLFMKSNKISITPDYLYNYFHRDDSIVSKISLKNKIANINSYICRLEELKNRYYENLTLKKIGVLISDNLVKLSFDSKERIMYKKQVQKCKFFCYKKSVINSVYKYANLKEKIVFTNYLIFGNHAHFIYCLAQKTKIIKFLKIINKFHKDRKEILSQLNAIKAQRNRKILLLNSYEKDNLLTHFFIENEKKKLIDQFEMDVVEISKKNFGKISRHVNNEDVLVILGIEDDNGYDDYLPKKLNNLLVFKKYKSPVLNNDNQHSNLILLCLNNEDEELLIKMQEKFPMYIVCFFSFNTLYNIEKEDREKYLDYFKKTLHYTKIMIIDNNDAERMAISSNILYIHHKGNSELTIQEAKKLMILTKH